MRREDWEALRAGKVLGRPGRAREDGLFQREDRQGREERKVDGGHLDSVSLRFFAGFALGV